MESKPVQPASAVTSPKTATTKRTSTPFDAAMRASDVICRAVHPVNHFTSIARAWDPCVFNATRSVTAFTSGMASVIDSFVMPPRLIRSVTQDAYMLNRDFVQIGRDIARAVKLVEEQRPKVPRQERLFPLDEVETAK